MLRTLMIALFATLILSSCNRAEVFQKPDPLDTRIVLSVASSDDTYTPDDLQQTATVIEQRLEILGLTNYNVQIEGSNHIVVEIPSTLDQQFVLDTIQQIGFLEFVDFSGLGGANLQEFVGQQIATDMRQSDALLNPITGEPFVTVMTGVHMQAASVENFSERWVIQFKLTEEGGEIFGAFTASHIGEPLAIVLDGQVLSIPIIQAALTTTGIISGNFTEEEAQKLAIQLQSGALAVPLTIESIESIEP